jgi:hypothetical protein
MKHPTTIEKYDGDLKQLAEDIGNLRYDALREFMFYFSNKIMRDSMSDGAKGRKKLSSLLGQTAVDINDAAVRMGRTWDICKPHMLIEEND